MATVDALELEVGHWPEGRYAEGALHHAELILLHCIHHGHRGLHHAALSLLNCVHHGCLETHHAGLALL